MDILTFSEQLQTRLKERLSGIDTLDEVAKIGEMLSFIRTILTELKCFTIDYQFKDESEEIRFFKEVKPVFLSQYFYYKKVFAMRLFDSYNDAKASEAKYYKHLGRLQQFVRKNLVFYEYCMTNSTHHDRQYFTRNQQSHKSFDMDEKFSTGYDNKLARILANELLRKHVLRLLHQSQNEEQGINSSLTWTGSKTDLIELIYALHSVDVFNNGACNIKLIASAFESLFNLSLGDYYRTFQDIRIRKKSLTLFLDQLKEKFEQRVNDEK